MKIVRGGEREKEKKKERTLRNPMRTDRLVFSGEQIWLMLLDARHHAQLHSAVPHIKDRNNSFGFFIFLFWPYVASSGGSRELNRYVDIFTSLNVLFVATVAFAARSAFMSINSVLSQLFDRQNTEKERERERESEREKKKQNAVKWMPHKQYTFYWQWQSFVAAQRISSDSKCHVHMSRLWWRTIAHTNLICYFIYFIKQYFSAICIWFLFLFFFPIVDAHHFTLSSCVDGRNFQFCRRFHRKQNK